MNHDDEMGIYEENYYVKRLKTMNELSLNEFLVFRHIGDYLIIINILSLESIVV